MNVSGEVTNNTSESLEAVEAVATFYTAQGEFVKTSSALVEYNPILSGQTSPFTVLDTGNPRISSVKIAFKYLLGGSISAIERAKLVAMQEAASKENDLRQQRQKEERAAAERQQFLAAHAAEAPGEWKALDSRLSDGVSPELREELTTFVEKYEGTAEAELASKELKAEAQLQLIDRYMKKGLREPAKKALQRLLKEYADTHTAEQARETFKGLQ